MSSYWARHRLLPTIAFVIVVSVMASLLFTYPLVEQKANAYNAQSVYKNSDTDFIVPEPSFDQVTELPGTKGIDKVFPFYLTKTTVEVSGKTRTTTVLLSDQFENVGITMYNESRLIKKADGNVDNPIYVDWQFCNDTSAYIGDTVSFSLSGGKVEFVIQAIYETNSVYDGGAILAQISPDQKNAIASNARSNGYSAAYISASDYSACKAFLDTDYRPLGRLRDRSQFDSDEQYNVHYDAIMASGYSNEITDFQVRANGLTPHVNSLMIWLGVLFVLAAVIAFNTVLGLRGCEKGFFTKNCIPKGINVSPYYTISVVFETIGLVGFYALTFILRMRFAGAYVPSSSVGLVVIIIPIAVVVAEFIASILNKAKVNEIIKAFQAEQARKKAEEERKKAEAAKQAQAAIQTSVDITTEAETTLKNPNKETAK